MRAPRGGAVGATAAHTVPKGGLVTGVLVTGSGLLASALPMGRRVVAARPAPWDRRLGPLRAGRCTKKPHRYIPLHTVTYRYGYMLSALVTCALYCSSGDSREKCCSDQNNRLS